MNMENLQLRPTETCPRSVKTIVVKSTVNGIYWDHINWFNPQHFCASSNPRPGFPMPYVMVFLVFNCLR